MSHETLKLNRHDTFDPDEGEILVHFKYYAGMPEQGPTYACGGTPAEPDEIEILKIETTGPMNICDGAHVATKAGVDITDLITEQEYDYIESQLYDNWQEDNDRADAMYEMWREDRDQK